jgi:hypothetical protein
VPRLGYFTPWERDPACIVQKAGWAPVPVWRSQENLAPTGIRFSKRISLRESLYGLNYLGAL